MQLGIICLSSSNWVSSLHLVLNRSSTRHTCGDYQAFNIFTRPNRHPIPHIHDVTAIKLGKSIFWKQIWLGHTINYLWNPQISPNLLLTTLFDLIFFSVYILVFVMLVRPFKNLSTIFYMVWIFHVLIQTMFWWQFLQGMNTWSI